MSARNPQQGQESQLPACGQHGVGYDEQVVCRQLLGQLVQVAGRLHTQPGSGLSLHAEPLTTITQAQVAAPHLQGLLIAHVAHVVRLTGRQHGGCVLQQDQARSQDGYELHARTDLGQHSDKFAGTDKLVKTLTGRVGSTIVEGADPTGVAMTTSTVGSQLLVASYSSSRPISAHAARKMGPGESLDLAIASQCLSTGCGGACTCQQQESFL